MKLLLANTNSQQLKLDASCLQNDGFDILITNSFDNLDKIISGKNPSIIFLTINQSEFEKANFFISSLFGFEGLMIIKVPKEFHLVSLFHKQFDLIQLKSEDILHEDIAKACNEYRKEKNSLNKEPPKSKITETIYNSILQNRTKKLAFAKENIYNYEKIFSLLKHDKVKILKSLNEFLSIIRNSISLTEQVLKTGEVDILRVTFHDILNLAEYYGANLLFKLVLEYKQETLLPKREKLLIQIHEEQKKVYNYYALLEDNLTSFKQLKRSVNK